MDEFERRACAFVQEHYPHAIAAFLGGSAATGTATESSDLDIVVVLSSAWDDTAFVETTTYEEQLVEAFVYGPAALQTWLEKGRRERRPVLDRLIGEGVALVDGKEAESLVHGSAEVLRTGAPPPEQNDLDVRAYSLSSLVDDLADADDPGIRTVVMASAWQEAAELALLSQGYWLGRGKWLLRELRRRGDSFGLAAWADGRGADPLSLASSCHAVLATVGGYRQEGFLRGVKSVGLSSASIPKEG